MANEVKQFERRVGPNERPAMPPVNGHALKFASGKLEALGREGLAGSVSEMPKPNLRGFNMELAGMAPPSNY